MRGTTGTTEGKAGTLRVSTLVALLGGEYQNVKPHVVFVLLFSRNTKEMDCSDGVLRVGNMSRNCEQATEAFGKLTYSLSLSHVHTNTVLLTRISFSTSGGDSVFK